MLLLFNTLEIVSIPKVTVNQEFLMQKTSFYFFFRKVSI